ncbi:Na+/H+ antiporter NhaA [Legionella hackeliae]|uniref:Na(+)/H(+) antiporter NhaA n=1 Tax=Legionella hackeliae TaxID=449 RepID=A0A0A8UXC2_LEGHA|nr:Na+/H+ antiporter NhaA [Legionella hackeliae]KTD12725.1 pH-dependent sodium/proton antiporter [Legionella hackeliae]CEK12146.1 Na(+)/H(+) antiporter nhaA 2 [Legionella hackeliae]STX48933.1 Na(+)/H(+) antiporter nhaA 1 (Sodium/proton antiporter nhaA 1) [Legionella hackeliae]
MKNMPNENNEIKPLPPTQAMAEKAYGAMQRFVEIEAVSGFVLLLSTAIALIWANSQLAATYDRFWHTSLSFGIGKFTFSKSLHFWINDGLMTFFFLIVGMEIRREIHDGSLSNRKYALLPIIAAIGGVVVPAFIFFVFNQNSTAINGWAIPTATDIAFAVGVLALLGSAIPSSTRLFLLTLAIIDDILAVLIIAIFYSEGLNYLGFLISVCGVLFVWSLQKIGVGSAFGYLIPGGIIWIGMLVTGIHPTLTGIVLGLMTPVRGIRMRETPLSTIFYISNKLKEEDVSVKTQRKLRLAQRELIPPVIRVEKSLHPWVAFFIIPLFALANAGVAINYKSFIEPGSIWLITGISLGLIFGKPLGIVGFSWISLRFSWCEFPHNFTWKDIWLVGLLAGIGFTMSIFIAMLAFKEGIYLNSAKLGVLFGSLISAVFGLMWGKLYLRKLKKFYK